MCHIVKEYHTDYSGSYPLNLGIIFIERVKGGCFGATPSPAFPSVFREARNPMDA